MEHDNINFSACQDDQPNHLSYDMSSTDNLKDTDIDTVTDTDKETVTDTAGSHFFLASHL